jgi:arsenical pump membrane protein
MLSAAIFAIARVLMIVQPRGLDVTWSAVGGAAACLAFGLVGWHDVTRVLGQTWNATLALIGLMLLSAVLDENGCFRAAAHWVARRARGSGRALFVGLCVSSAVAAALLANDGAILILTPIVIELAELLALPRDATIAYLFAVGFLCDAMSATLPASNLTNILLMDAMAIAPGELGARMALPMLASFVMATAVLALLFARALPARFDAAALGPPPTVARPSARASAVALVVLVAGYGLSAVARVPIGVVVFAVAAALAGFERARGVIRTRRVARRLPWSIVAFASALFLVVTALAQHGVGAALARAFAAGGGGASRAHVLAVGAGVGALACVGNNLPVLLISALALDTTPAPGALPFAALLGANVGSKLLPAGSLATLLWLGILKRRGLRLSWMRYVALAFLPTVLTLLAALLALPLSK